MGVAESLVRVGCTIVPVSVNARYKLEHCGFCKFGRVTLVPLL
jgi:hypothetical protein